MKKSKSRMVKSGKPKTKRPKKCLPIHLTLPRSYAIVTYNYTVAMKRRVRRDGIPRELRMVKRSIEISAEDGLRARKAES